MRADCEIRREQGRQSRSRGFCFCKTGMLTCTVPVSGMRSQLKFVITGIWLCHLILAVPLVTSQTLPAQNGGEPGGYCFVLPAPSILSQGRNSGATLKNTRLANETHPVKISARQCEKNGNEYALRGDVRVEFADYRFQGDTVTYNSVTGDTTASGNAQLDGGPRDIHITASHAAYNLRTRTGKFYDVIGTTGARFQGKNVTLTSSSPIAFTGRMVEQTGPEEYVLHHGSVTSCELPHPKWTFNAEKIVLRVGKSAQVYHGTFRLKGVPVFYLPYAAPPVERLGRQSGFLLPNVGTSSTKGNILGDSFYWAINRSMDATLGGEYLSKRGWSLQESFRAVPSRDSYLNLNYFQVLDRGIAGTNTQGQPATINQGGEDIKLNGEALFPHNVRGVASLDYLSSFAFRLAFTENFSQAVNSEVSSVAFLSKSAGAYSLNAFGSRYQNFQSTTPGDAITILGAPGIASTGIDRPLFGSPVYAGYDADAEGLRRSEPGFVIPGVVGRFDVDPDISLPLQYHGWAFRPEVQLRNTVYTEQQVPAEPDNVPIHNPLNRRMIQSSLELRPPALVRIFDRTIAGHKVKHVIEPRITYRYDNGVEDFFNIIRFDFRDIFSNTNEVEYGLTQRLYLKSRHDDCLQQQQELPPPAVPDANGRPRQPAKQPSEPASTCGVTGGDAFITWDLKQKYFLDPNFGGAIVNGQRNVLFTTVDFTGIAFLTEPRRFAPLVSRLRMRTSSNSDLEWELDYDTKKGHINSSTLYTTAHFGDFFVGASHAYFIDPGEVVNSPITGTPLPSCSSAVFGQQRQCVSVVFNQLRALLGYGSPTKEGVERGR